MCEMMPVGRLEVLAYVSVECPRHPQGWALRPLPVADCAYCQCAKSDDRRPYDEYMSIMARRDADAARKWPYDNYFAKLVREIAADREFKLQKKGPIVIYPGTRWILDGHHRAAIICAKFSEDYRVPVATASAQPPDDINLPCNPCKMEAEIAAK